MKLLNKLFPKTYCKHGDTTVSKTTRPYSEFINEVLVERYCKKCFLQLSSRIFYEGVVSESRTPEVIKKEVLDLISGRVKY